MPFLRPGHDGTFASPIAPSAPKSRRVSQYLTLFSLSAASLAGSASAKPFRAVGVKAWTSGSQTFIRARPGAEVPPVAKVDRHTPLYVWGKYNGWYRVETHDHIFGWVYNQYIETPKAYKVRTMPHTKAKIASNRTADQKVYGSPHLLKKYFASYGAPGASKSEQKPRIRLASNRKIGRVSEQAAAKPKLFIAKAIPQAVVAKAVSTRTPRLKVAEHNIPRLANALRPKTRIAAVSTPKVAAPRVISPVPRVEQAVRVAQTPKTVTKPTVRVASAKTETQRTLRSETPTRNNETPTRNLAPALSGKMSGYAAPRVEAFEKSPGAMPVAPVETPSAPRQVESGKIAGSSRALSPSARFFARAANEAALRRESPVSAPGTSASDAPLTDSNFEPIPVVPPVAAITPSAPRPKVRATRVRRSAKAAKKKSLARTASKKRYASRKERQREQLRARMGMVPTAPHSVIAPVSPTELMNARREYLNGRKARLGLPASPQNEAPITPVSPLPVPNGPLGGPSSNELAPLAPAQFAPMSFESSHPLAPLMGDPYVVALAQLKSKPKIVASNDGALVGVASVAPLAAPLLPPLATRGGSPRDRGMSRGGSPRDRFGAGMASQALSYRGMRYIRGAASPRRGFDCSGLVYFLLRQRGYNPPRTAAGYAHWGQSVPKNQLKSGDLVLFANTYKRGVSHIGVYMGEGKFVHAATSATGVRVSSLKESYYAGKYFGARRAK